MYNNESMHSLSTISSIIDHYKTLGLGVNASTRDVKSAFRALAKKYHPDKNAGRSSWATAKMKRLIEAHHVLSSASLRGIYDRQYWTLMRTHAPRRRPAEKRRTRAEQILEKLLSRKEAEAVAIYEELLKKHKGFDLSKQLKPRDWIDCKFLIAEQYEKQEEYGKAADLYEALYHCDEAQGRYSQFVHELRERLARLYCRDLAPSAAPDDAAQYYLRALSLETSRNRRAFLHKKLAECHLALDNTDEARRQLAIAFQLKPDLKGAAKICQKLGFVPG